MVAVLTAAVALLLQMKHPKLAVILAVVDRMIVCPHPQR